MGDPCAAEKVASRRGVRRFNGFKAVVTLSLTAFTALLVALPSLAAQINFLPETDDLADGDPGTLVVRVVPFREVELVAGDDDFDAADALDAFEISDGIPGAVTVREPGGTSVAEAATGDEISLSPGSYLVTVETDETSAIPTKLVTIESDVVHDLVIELDGSASSPDPGDASAPSTAGGSLEGIVTHAATDEVLEGATVCVQGTDACGISDGSGRYAIDTVPAGDQRLDATLDGFISVLEIAVEVAVAETTTRNIAMSPPVPEGQWRVVLSWDDEPADLDSFLILPPNGEADFLYHRRKDAYGSTLDVDKRSGGGPETVTIVEWNEGRYSYYIHNYTQWEGETDRTLSESGATVRILVGAETARVVEVPAGEGLWWHVFDVDWFANEFELVNVITDDAPVEDPG